MIFVNVVHYYSFKTAVLLHTDNALPSPIATLIQPKTAIPFAL